MSAVPNRLEEMEAQMDAADAVGGIDPVTSYALGQNHYLGIKNHNDYDAAIIQKWMDQQYNAAEAQKNRDWQERMSNTQYRRAMADLKAAGVNPYYLFSQGGSAASASGGSAATSSGTAIPSGSKSGQTAVAALAAVAKIIALIAAA